VKSNSGNYGFGVAFFVWCFLDTLDATIIAKRGRNIPAAAGQRRQAMKTLLIIGNVIIGLGHLSFLLPAAITALLAWAFYTAGFAGHRQ